MSKLSRVTYLLTMIIALTLLTVTDLVVADSPVILNYNQYLTKYGTADKPEQVIIIQAEDYSGTDTALEIVPNLAGIDGSAIITPEKGFVEWEIEVAEAGLYNIGIKYYPIRGKGGAIERGLLLNGEIPFEGANYLAFSRVWEDAEPIKMDNQGNELRPSQREHPIWQEVTFQDSLGKQQESYQFYLPKGRNTLRLVARREPMAIDYLKIFQETELLDYAATVNLYAEKGYQPTSGVFLKLQERDVTYKSNSTFYPFSENRNPTMEPYHHVLIRLNAIGGWNWDQAGEWLSWEFEVPQSGLYQIALKGTHDMRGYYANRRLYINDQVPFSEAKALRFPASPTFQMHPFGLTDGEGDQSYLFYLEKGRNTLKLEVVLGDLVEIIRTVEASLYELNNIYRKIIMVTSPIPDPLRTYQLEKRIPGLLERLAEQSQVIEGLVRTLEEYTGQKGGHTLMLTDLARQLNDLAIKPESIPGRLNELRDNLAGLGGWLAEATKQPLVVDYIIVASPDQELPKAEPILTQTLKHETKAFLASFTHNYKMVGNVYDRALSREVKPLTVWIGYGRDQAQTLKKLIENDFTPKTGIPVNLELISPAVLLPATFAGEGPDIALGIPAAQPINFAIRGAVVDLAQFQDFPEVAARFKKSAFAPFKFRDSVYALPEQQPFPMLFYRKDILAEKGLAVPQTWEDVMAIIPELQKDNLSFGLPVSHPLKFVDLGVGQVSASVGSLSASGGVFTFLTFLYQNGEELYLEDGIATNLDSEVAVEAFSRWTDLYELYDLPLMYDLANRFRTGEIPVLLTGYNFYNMISVFAPELRGKWDFTLVPGTVQADGSIDRSIPAGGAGAMGDSIGGPGCMILEKAQDHEAAWEFLKWWTSKDIQVAYALELESLLGPIGRYAAANIEAFSMLPWSLENYEKLTEQWKWVKGVPEIPGGYTIGRHLDNAFRKVVYRNKPARDTLFNYNRKVNEEITRKRLEFGLETELEQVAEKWRKFYWLE